MTNPWRLRVGALSTLSWNNFNAFCCKVALVGKQKVNLFKHYEYARYSLVCQSREDALFRAQRLRDEHDAQKIKVNVKCASDASDNAEWLFYRRHPGQRHRGSSGLTVALDGPGQRHTEDTPGSWTLVCNAAAGTRLIDRVKGKIRAPAHTTRLHLTALNWMHLSADHACFDVLLYVCSSHFYHFINVNISWKYHSSL